MSSTPMRVQAGFTQDADWQPLGLLGTPNPFFYAQYHDDYIGYVQGRYTNTNTGNGTVAQAAGNTGRLLFTTNSSTPAASDISSHQVDAAAFTPASTKKLAYLTRLQLASVATPGLIAGLIQTTTTPFTVTDGIYFYKAAGSSAVSLIVTAGSSVISTTSVPVTLTANTDVDLGWVYNGKGDILIFAGANLIGQQNQNTANLGPIARVTPSSLPAAVLNPTLALQSGTTASTTMNADLQFCALER